MATDKIISPPAPGDILSAVEHRAFLLNAAFWQDSLLQSYRERSSDHRVRL